jgi:hypothetical protein
MLTGSLVFDLQFAGIVNDKCLMITPQNVECSWLDVDFWQADFSLFITVILAE